MNVLVVFVEVTEYNLARMHNVYECDKNIHCDYVYLQESLSGHEHSRQCPDQCIVLKGSNREKRKRLIAIMKAKKYDFLQINGYSDVIRLSLIMYAKLHHIPYAIESDTQLAVPKNILKRCIKSLLLHFVFSGNGYGFAGGSRQRRLFSYYGMAESHIYTLPMTVDAATFSAIAQTESKEEYKRRLGFGDKKVVLYAGRFEPEKNIEVLLTAFQGLCRRHQDCVLCLIGKGSLKEDLQNLCERTVISDRVYFYPYMLMPMLAEYYSMADVFVLPSVYEPWGLVVNEALACRTPVIASDRVGAVDDLISAGINGDVFPYADAGTLSDMIEKWLYGEEITPDFQINDRWNYDLYMKQWKAALLDIVQAQRNGYEKT